MTDIDLLRLVNRTNGEYRRRHHVVLERSGYQGLYGNGRLLHELAKNDELPQKELARRLEIRPQSLTEALGKLEQAGYIVRKRSQTDKREQYVYITDLGRERSQKLREMRLQVATEMFGCLSDEEKETMYNLLTRVMESENTED